MRLLCVEDEASLREDIVEYLRMKSYEVDEAASGEDAIEQMNRHHYDLVLCDIKMPRMDGYELLKQVRSENNLAGTPFIFLSALNERDDKMRAHEGGCDGYLTKPIDFSLLDVTLKSYVERQRARDFLYTNLMESNRQQVLTALDDALNGPMSEASLVVQHIRDTLPLLTPSALDQSLAYLQERVSRHALELDGLHSALQLQMHRGQVLCRSISVEELVQAAVEECRYISPASEITFAPSDATAACQVSVDVRLMQRAMAGLLALIPHARSTQEVVSFAIAPDHWMLTLCDHPSMAQEEDFTPVDEGCNLSVLAPVTRQRLVPLLFAMQVAHAHGGRLELMIWPGDHLAVRFVLPQTNANSIPA